MSSTQIPVVTGANKGIGFEIAKQLAQHEDYHMLFGDGRRTRRDLAEGGCSITSVSSFLPLMANPPTALLLAHRGVEAWLTNQKSHSIPHGETTVSGNQITTTVKVPVKTAQTKNKLVLPSSKRSHENVKVAAHFMDATKADTQYTTAKTWDSSSDKDGWFNTPPAAEKGGFVQLEIRRTKGTPERVSNFEPNSRLETIELDLIDDENDPPFIVFRFEFVPPTKRRQTPDANATPNKRKKTDITEEELQVAKDQHSRLLKTPNKPKNTSQKTPDKSAKKTSTPNNSPKKTSTPNNSPKKASKKTPSGDSGGGELFFEKSIVDKLIAAKAEADELDAALQKQLAEIEKDNAAKRELLGK
ncbi:hypothetical protein C8R44DRAFT_737780 [Mycena epipterygia]|nr:hypothetical protein C8R44DRAFT_737780 [Mycena epipterygia]